MYSTVVHLVVNLIAFACLWAALVSTTPCGADRRGCLRLVSTKAAWVVLSAFILLAQLCESNDEANVERAVLISHRSIPHRFQLSQSPPGPFTATVRCRNFVTKPARASVSEGRLQRAVVGRGNLLSCRIARGRVEEDDPLVFAAGTTTRVRWGYADVRGGGAE